MEGVFDGFVTDRASREAEMTKFDEEWMKRFFVRFQLFPARILLAPAHNLHHNQPSERLAVLHKVSPATALVTHSSTHLEPSDFCQHHQTADDEQERFEIQVAFPQ